MNPVPLAACRCAALLVIISSPALFGQEKEQPLAPFGFSGLEIHKIDRGVGDLRCRDLNNDGRKDLLIVNNSRATIEILLQRSPEEMAKAAQESAAGKGVNDIPGDTRFRREKIVTEKHVFALAIDDFNDDKFPDIAYFGDPPELVVVHGTKDGWSGDRTTLPVKAAATARATLASADFNGDGLTDLALLGERETWLFYQDGKGKLQPPARLPNHEKEIAAMWACDLNGDKRMDLVYINPASPRPVSVRFQGKGGPGDLVSMKLPPFDVIDVTDVDGDGAAEVVAVSSSTGRLNSYRWKKEQSSSVAFAVRMIPFRETGSRRGASLVGDLTGDGRPEILTLRPESAQIEMIRPDVEGAASIDVFPTLADCRAATLADPDGDGRRELIVASSKEKAIGVARWTASGLAFPDTMALEDKVVCLASGRILGGEKDDVVIVTQNDDGCLLRVVNIDSGIRERYRLPIAKSVPEGVRVFDVNQDGAADILLFVPYEPMIVLLNTGKGADAPSFENLSAKGGFQSGLVNEAKSASFATADVNGDRRDEFLLAKQNFVRAMAVDASGRLAVRRQMNLSSASNTVGGAVAVDLDGDRTPEICMMDETENRLQILKLLPTGTELLQSVDCSMIKPKEIAAADVNGDGKPDILLIAEDAVVILRQGEGEDRLVPGGSYESEHENGVLGNFVCGDLNGDGRRDFAVVEESEQGLSLLTSGKKGEWLKVLGFKIYEGKSFRKGDEDDYSTEPREMVIDDVTGDGKNDLILLIHDRIIVYPQE